MMKKTKVNKLKQFKHKFDCMLCTILGHDPIKVFEQRERRHGHKTCLGGWNTRKGGKPGSIVTSMGFYYKQKMRQETFQLDKCEQNTQHSLIQIPNMFASV
jgi:hypothetical protein